MNKFQFIKLLPVFCVTLIAVWTSAEAKSSRPYQYAPVVQELKDLNLGIYFSYLNLFFLV